MPLPSLEIRRDGGGRVAITAPKAAGFGWKPHGQGDTSATPLDIYYTLDGSDPGPTSLKYTGPFEFASGGRVRALAMGGGKAGPITEARLSIPRDGWSVRACSSEENARYAGAMAIDGDPASFWHSRWTGDVPHPHTLEVDLGKVWKISGLTYLPRQDKAVPDGMVEEGTLSFSRDGSSWSPPRPFKLGNLVNDPSERVILLENGPMEARYFRFTSTAGAAGKPYAAAAEIGVLAD
jgi:alpha-L-fucosidase